MPICYCLHCGIKFARRSHGMKDALRYCSQKCSLKDRIYSQTSIGTIKVENEYGKIVQTSKFNQRKELIELLELFKSAPVLIVTYD